MRSQSRPRDPIFALPSPSPLLSTNPVTHSAVSPPPPRPRAPNYSHSSAFPRAHPNPAPKHYFAHSAPPHLSELAPPKNPVGRLPPPGPPRRRPRPTQKCRKSPCGHNGPLCGLADQNSRSQGRGQGRASGWPRWDPLPLLQFVQKSFGVWSVLLPPAFARAALPVGRHTRGEEAPWRTVVSQWATLSFGQCSGLLLIRRSTPQCN